MIKLLLLLLVAVPAALAAFALEKRRISKQTAPVMPYKWGYFQGASGLLLGMWTLLACLYGIGSDNDADGVLLALLLALTWGASGFYVIRRHRWAWVVHTVASFNPLWYIANFFYARNRWHEFAAEARQNGRPSVVVARTGAQPSPLWTTAFSADLGLSPDQVGALEAIRTAAGLTSESFICAVDRNREATKKMFRSIYYATRAKEPRLSDRDVFGRVILTRYLWNRRRGKDLFGISEINPTQHASFITHLILMHGYADIDELTEAILKDEEQQGERFYSNEDEVASRISGALKE